MIMVMVTTYVTEAVLEQHIQAMVSRNLDNIVQDYADDAVIFAPNGVFKGSQHIRAFFKAALESLTPEAMDDLKFSKKEFEGEYAYVLWSAGTVVPFAGDLFRIRDGKIVTQAIVQQTSS
jgi:ketosteroid isomerase-like protein